MANLDVALRLRLLNGLKPGAKDAQRDLEGVGNAARKLNDTKGGDALARDLGKVATAGSRADAVIRKVAADGTGLSATGGAAGRLGTQLTSIATAGGRADAAIRKLGSGAPAFSATGTAAGRLGGQLSAVATAGGRADAALKGIGSSRAGLAGLDGVAKALAADLDRVAAAGRRAQAAGAAMVPRVRGAVAPNVTPWGATPIPVPVRPPGRAKKTEDDETPSRRTKAGNAFGLTGGSMIGGALGASALASGYRQSAAFDRRITMIGQTAEASREQIDTLGASVHDLAQETATPADKVAGGLEALVAQGRNLKEAMGFLPSVARTAAASGSAVDDIAKSADSVGSNFDIAGKRMQSAFDIMAAGGKAGQFELKDMARYLPSLSPAAKAQGFKGEKGLADIVAMLQIIRKGSGTAEEAAVSMTNIFQKLNSEESAKNFKKMGVDLEEALKKGRAEGRNLVEVLEEATQKATKGDLSLMPKLFKDQEFGRGMLALMTYRGEWQKLSETLQTTSGGTVVRDLVQVTKDAQASVDRLSNSWDRFIQAASRAADAGGVSAGLGEAGKEFQTIAAALERINKAYAEGGLSGAMKQAGGDAADRVRENRKDWLDHRVEQEGGRIAEMEADNRAFRDKLTREGRSEADIASTMRLRDEAVRKARLRKQAAETARAAPTLADRTPLRMGVDPRAPIQGETAPVGIGTVEFNKAYPLDPRRRMTVPLPPSRPANVPTWRGIDRIEDVLGQGTATKPDRFSLDGGTATRTEMQAAMEAYAARKRAQAPAVLARPSATARFDLGGPVAAGSGGIARAPGTATKFPMAESLLKATFDPQPIISGVRQAEDAAKGLQTSLGQDLSGPARQSMETFNGALSAGVQKAIAMAVAAAAQMQASLSFTATPTIAPRMVPPVGGGSAPAATAGPASASAPAARAPRLQSAGLRRSGPAPVQIAAVHVHGVRDMAGMERSIRREADRRARDSRDGALHDTGSEVA